MKKATPMAVAIEQKDDYCLLKISGSFDSHVHMGVRQAANKAADLPVAKMVFDLTDCTYIDSSAIGILVEFYRRLTPLGRRVGILRPNADVRHLIGLTRTDTLVSVYESEEAISADD
jgi:stage II sporulation protein AA (anti-sigma F factor antagonist)